MSTIAASNATGVPKKSSGEPCPVCDLGGEMKGCSVERISFRSALALTKRGMP
ncbi:hypothetical protein ACFMQL_21205 [Nonomuraea fastidiosa]|uniref:hypothetical protein n=1 Tax=Nonomuraea fastidiosa TaxID=46173 RepID=UPI00366A6BC6